MLVLGVFVLVVLAYILFFAYDIRTINSSNNSYTHLLFAIGCALIVLAVAVLVVSQFSSLTVGALTVLFMLLACISFALMVKALFFSLPQGTYSHPEQGRCVYRQGMYALCRHPGVLWYCLFFLFLCLSFGTTTAWICGGILCAGNVAYMYFQDAWSFPRTFCDYNSYKQQVPFFFPTLGSIRAALSPFVEGGAA